MFFFNFLIYILFYFKEYIRAFDPDFDIYRKLSNYYNHSIFISLILFLIN